MIKKNRATNHEMEEQSMKIFYFTSTGNCLEVSKKIGGELYSIPHVLKSNVREFEDDQIGIVFPTYLGSTPPIVIEFMQKVKLKTNYFFGIATYGKLPFGILDHFDKNAKENGLEPKYLNKIIMVDNALRLFDMDKEVRTLGKKKVDASIKKVANDINTKKEARNTSNFIMKRLSTSFYNVSVKQEPTNYKQFTVESHCTGCKTCEKACPLDNIKVSKTPQFDTHCVSCYACTHNCPENAIRVTGEKSKARYRNKNINLGEIIAANQAP